MLWKSQVIIIKIMFYEDFYAFLFLALLPGLQHTPQSYSADIQSLFLTPPPFLWPFCHYHQWQLRGRLDCYLIQHWAISEEQSSKNPCRYSQWTTLKSVAGTARAVPHHLSPPHCKEFDLYSLYLFVFVRTPERKFYWWNIPRETI